MDFSSAGIKDAVIKMLKVAGYVAISGAVVALIEWIGKLNLDPANYWMIAAVGVINMLLAGILKWIGTKK